LVGALKKLKSRKIKNGVDLLECAERTKEKKDKLRNGKSLSLGQCQKGEILVVWTKNVRGDNKKRGLYPATSVTPKRSRSKTGGKR